MKFIKSAFFCVLVALILPLHVNAKQKVVVEESDKEVTINFQDLQINDFVKLVSNILNKNILLQAPIAGKVDFVSTTPVKKKDLPAILQSVLGTKSFSLVDRGSFLEVVKSKDASKYNLPLVNSLGDSYLQMVTKIIVVKNINVDIIASKIKHLGSASSSVLTIKDSNSLLITDFPKNIKTIEKVIHSLENSEQVKVQFFKLKNQDIGYIYPVVTGIVKSRFNSKVETEKVTVISDKANNTIIAVGTSKNLHVVKKIINQFDIKNDIDKKQNKVITLKNIEVNDALKVVTGLVKAGRTGNSTPPPIIMAEPKSNSLVISGMGSDIQEVQELVKELDKEQRQVYVKAKIIEISKDQSLALGAKYGLEAGQMSADGLYTLAMGFGGPSVALSSNILGFFKPEKDLKSGLALGAAIDFLASNGAANIVSEPSVLCLNNQESKIYVGQTESIITSSTTTDNTQDLSRSTFSREDIGLSLKVKPRISNDGKVTLEAETVIEDVLPNSRAGMPTTTKREVTTKAIVKNGESVIVGGLIRDKSSTTTSKVPLLGDIPVVGNIFTHNSQKGDNVNIVIILTPYIVDTSDNLTNLREHLVELDNLQNRYNKEFVKNIEKISKKNKIKPKTKDPIEFFYGKDRN